MYADKPMEGMYKVSFRDPDGKDHTRTCWARSDHDAIEQISDYCSKQYPQDDPEARPRWFVRMPKRPDMSSREYGNFELVVSQYPKHDVRELFKTKEDAVTRMDELWKDSRIVALDLYGEGVTIESRSRGMGLPDPYGMEGFES